MILTDETIFISRNLVTIYIPRQCRAWHVVFVVWFKLKQTSRASSGAHFNCKRANCSWQSSSFLRTFWSILMPSFYLNDLICGAEECCRDPLIIKFCKNPQNTSCEEMLDAFCSRECNLSAARCFHYSHSWLKSTLKYQLSNIKKLW